MVLNSWRICVIHKYVTILPPAILKRQWHTKEAQNEPPLIKCECDFRIRRHIWKPHIDAICPLYIKARVSEKNNSLIQKKPVCML